MTLQTIDPARAKRLHRRGRRAGRHPRAGRTRARARARRPPQCPLSRLAAVAARGAKAVIFHCRSGARTAPTRRVSPPQPAARPTSSKAASTPGRRPACRSPSTAASRSRSCARSRSPPARWCCWASCSALGRTGVPGLSAFVGAGLVFAGTSGWCGMAQLLGLMPWNRRAPRYGDGLMVALPRLALGSGGLIGLMLGLIGGGGSILAVPLLIYAVGVSSPHVAIGTAAFAVAVNAAASLGLHARRHRSAGPARWCSAPPALPGRWRVPRWAR